MIHNLITQGHAVNPDRNPSPSTSAGAAKSKRKLDETEPMDDDGPMENNSTASAPMLDFSKRTKADGDQPTEDHNKGLCGVYFLS